MYENRRDPSSEYASQQTLCRAARSSRRSSRRSSLHSRASMSTARVDIPAAAVWEALKSHVQLVGAQQFDPLRFEAELEESAGGGNLNYLTKQRVQIAAQKLLGQDIVMEFEGLS